MGRLKDMKAAQLLKFGEGGVAINEVEKPAVAQGKILVEVYAAGVNPFDWKVRSGVMQIPLPMTLGGDFSGVVAGVGTGVSDYRIGEAIFGSASTFSGGSGSFAQFALADSGHVALKPKSVDYLEAGALPLAGVSAWQVLTEHMKLALGQKILIHGGAGGIGSIAIQIAKHLGAHVATVVGTSNVDYVKELGADEVVDYKRQKFEEVLSGYDAIFDTVGGETYKNSFKVLKKGGVIVSMVEKPDLGLMDQYGVRAIVQMTQVTSQRLSKLAELVDQGVVKVHVEKTFPLEQADEALTYLEKMHPRGKVVLKIK